MEGLETALLVDNTDALLCINTMLSCVESSIRAVLFWDLSSSDERNQSNASLMSLLSLICMPVFSSIGTASQ
ncbi:hypothetical protein TVAG_516450 [Trichomonas vaginalis G3]|uniref:Uncharacterized protein n=1 Tax=Trichomonas vaginalis (strain ATCC PRA-98 / G3) TaxID=412133 RepID=A2GYT7_TRIV3|nr:hypothetical protein TVAG_516450 [Trichomonas vaginalis G3]|eukprot:XP_001290610.1 hypothetical protein [Trichomonas vaginalis G3]